MVSSIWGMGVRSGCLLNMRHRGAWETMQPDGRDVANTVTPDCEMIKMANFILLFNFTQLIFSLGKSQVKHRDTYS